MFIFVSFSADEPSNSAEDKQASTDTIGSNNKRSLLYGTAPRSKVSQAVDRGHCKDEHSTCLDWGQFAF